MAAAVETLAPVFYFTRRTHVITLCVCGGSVINDDRFHGRKKSVRTLNERTTAVGIIVADYAYECLRISLTYTRPSYVTYLCHNFPPRFFIVLFALSQNLETGVSVFDSRVFIFRTNIFIRVILTRTRGGTDDDE